MSEFRTGNVVKLNTGTIVIVVDSNETTTRWIDFSYSNCSGTTRNKTYMSSVSCFCCETNDGEYDEYCEDCKGTGSYEEERDGMDKAKLLGENVKSYIITCLTKNFNF